MKKFNQFKEDYEKRGKSALRNIGNTTIDYFSGGGDVKGFGDVLRSTIGKEIQKNKKPVLNQLKKDFNKNMK
jgi:hypothetical protein